MPWFFIALPAVPVVLALVAAFGWWVQRSLERRASRSRVRGALGQLVELVERLTAAGDEASSDLAGSLEPESIAAAFRRVRRELSIHERWLGRRWRARVRRCLDLAEEAIERWESARHADAAWIPSERARVERLRSSLRRQWERTL